MPTGADDVHPDAALIDVAGMTFGAVLELDSALAEALRRQAEQPRSTEDFYAAFGNFAPEPGQPPTSTAGQS